MEWISATPRPCHHNRFQSALSEDHHRSALAAAKNGLARHGTWLRMNRTLKCVRCGAELADGDRFCGECGNRVVALPPESGRLPPVVHAAPRRPPAATVLAVVVGALVIVAAFGLRNRVAMPTP